MLKPPIDVSIVIPAYNEGTRLPSTLSSRLDGFEFDLEILFLARRLGFEVAEIGIEWRDVPGSKVHAVRDGLRMLGLIGRLRWMHAGSKTRQQGSAHA